MIGSILSHFRIVSRLGAGGMGVVYLARDEALGRNIALKVLPAGLVKDEGRVRRFVQEAKSASSLSHPHIVTIHEIGQAALPDSQVPIYFIAMELVEGSTLRQLIHQEKTELRTLLRFLAQAADGLSKAHAAGIVHRDLKPDNIMVTRDGYAKVLDFGLAKLTERQAGSPDDRTSAETETKRVTGEGAVMGTVGYMSPEQAQGKPADHRSDIFSFGCILYEAATRTKPFTGDSDVEILHKILKEQPVSVEELNAQVPAEVRRLIRRCLAKDPNQRLDSMKVLAIELNELAGEYETLSTSSSPSVATQGSPGTGIPWRLVGLVALSVAVLAAAIYTVSRTVRDRSVAPPQTAAVRITPITNRGDVGDIALSMDGHYLAYTSGPEGREDLRVHQINTGSDVEILPPGPGMSNPHLSFSKDGDRLYFTRSDTKDGEEQTLLEIPSLGGAPKELAHVGQGAAVSPDGKSVCFLRRPNGDGAWTLVLLDLASAREKTLTAEESLQNWFSSSPAWSPDGSQIAIGHGEGESSVDVTLIDVSTGKRNALRLGTWAVRSLDWMPDAGALILTAWEPGGIGIQAWYQPTSGAPARRITNDSNRYGGVTASADGRTIAAIREVAVNNLWTADFTPGHPPRQLTFASSPDNAPAYVASTEDGAAYRVSDHSVWRVGLDGSARKLVAPPGEIVYFMRALPNGDLVFNCRDERTGVIHVMRADADGNHARPLTAGAGEGLLALSPDGKTALYVRLDHVTEIWAVSTDGGSPWRVADAETITDVIPKFSLDGRRILAPLPPQAGGNSGQSFGIFAVTGGERLGIFTAPADWKDAEWYPDGKSVTFVRDTDGVDNLVLQPLAGGAPTLITHFTEGRIGDHEWPQSGDRILFARTIGRGCEVTATAADGSRAQPIARFETGQLDGVAWTKNGAAVVFLYGTAGTDAVLIRDFQ